jgi:hypothetical protein
MTKLEERLRQFQSLVESWGVPLSWSRVFIVEGTSISRGSPSLIRRAHLFTPEQYADKFDEHLSEGYSWINMNAAGILNDALLVIVELPIYKSGLAKDKVPVNYSGAAMAGGKPEWDASKQFIIVD